MLAAEANIWPEFEELFKDQTPQNWFNEVQSRLLDRNDLAKIHHSAKTMTHAYQGKDPRLASGFALVASLSALFDRRLSPALEIYTWIKEQYPQHMVTNKLHSLLASYLNEENQKPKHKEIYELDLFAHLDESSLEKLLMIPNYKKYSAGENIFNIDSPADKMYVITTGSVDIVDPEGFTFTLSEGQYFGEVSLLLAHHRHSRGAIAKTNLELLEFDRTHLSQWFQEFPRFQDQIIKTCFLRSFLNYAHSVQGLKEYEDYELRDIYQFFEVGGFKKGRVLFSSGGEPEDIYFVIEGHISIMGESSRLKLLGPGQFIGEMAGLSDRKHHYSAVAEDRAFLLSCKKENFEKLCKDYPRFQKFLTDLSETRIKNTPQAKRK